MSAVRSACIWSLFVSAALTACGDGDTKSGVDPTPTRAQVTDAELSQACVEEQADQVHQLAAAASCASRPEDLRLSSPYQESCMILAGLCP